MFNFYPGLLHMEKLTCPNNEQLHLHEKQCFNILCMLYGFELYYSNVMTNHFGICSMVRSMQVNASPDVISSCDVTSRNVLWRQVLHEQEGWDRGRSVGAPKGYKQHSHVWAQL